MINASVNENLADWGFRQLLMKAKSCVLPFSRTWERCFWWRIKAPHNGGGGEFTPSIPCQVEPAGQVQFTGYRRITIDPGPKPCRSMIDSASQVTRASHLR